MVHEATEKDKATFAPTAAPLTAKLRVSVDAVQVPVPAVVEDGQPLTKVIDVPNAPVPAALKPLG